MRMFWTMILLWVTGTQTAWGGNGTLPPIVMDGLLDVSVLDHCGNQTKQLKIHLRVKDLDTLANVEPLQRIQYARTFPNYYY